MIPHSFSIRREQTLNEPPLRLLSGTQQLQHITVGEDHSMKPELFDSLIILSCVKFEVEEPNKNINFSTFLPPLIKFNKAQIRTQN